MLNKELFEEYVSLIQSEKYNCIVIKGADVRKFKAPGVKTLMTLLKEEPEFMKDSYVFDSVVGKGAAALMILGKVKEIYAGLISEHAIKLLEKAGIKYRYGEEVPFIENKLKTGLCPIEKLAIPSNEPNEIYEKILGFISNSKPNNTK